MTCDVKKREHLKDAAHPLEAVFFRGVWPLLCHDDDPLVTQHGHRKYRYPEHKTWKTLLQLDCDQSSSCSGLVKNRAQSVCQTLAMKENWLILFFTSPCTQTSWARLPVLWQLRHLHCVSAHWPPSAHPSSRRQTQGCPRGAHTAHAVGRIGSRHYTNPKNFQSTHPAHWYCRFKSSKGFLQMIISLVISLSCPLVWAQFFSLFLNVKMEQMFVWTNN